MADTTKTPTHTAFAVKRAMNLKRQGRWLEIGKARIDEEGGVHVFLDRLPVGGFNGYVYLAPLGTQPPRLEPQRPRAFDEDELDG
ncbi:conserved protein of unknown function (plasmid) [Rhodovastum atsumiense]|uniref:Uncharacterized protein n=1 Tax=Rhodovastum atsumiense TaxID=504468 RepID=A0A5M6INK4_9PROT|nr:hypothetical protein [Rhodovastum atsumiense]KAA5609567.1 hypothetical protein F1189_23370 [Rhodovastum atsumiense]CAH2606396.1 conserved protein of unknown function [Rhodovastum atsumiense]